MAGLARITSNPGFEGYHDNISVQEQLCFFSHYNMPQSISLMQDLNCMLCLNGENRKEH